MAQVHERERQLTREVTVTVEQGLPGVEVLAVELSGPERFTVYIDHSAGVDHARAISACSARLRPAGARRALSRCV